MTVTFAYNYLTMETIRNTHNTGLFQFLLTETSHKGLVSLGLFIIEATYPSSYAVWTELSRPNGDRTKLRVPPCKLLNHTVTSELMR